MGAGAADRSWSARGGQQEREGRALRRVALDFDQATAHSDEVAHHGEPETGSDTDAFRREERLEHLGHRLRVDAAAVVGDSQERIRRVGTRCDPSRDGQPATRGHGVARIDGEVEQRLIELGRIDGDETGLLDRERDEIHVGADQAAKHRMGGGHDLVQVDDLADSRLLAAEGQQPLRQVAGLCGRERDLLQVVAKLRVVSCLLQRELSVPADDDEQVVEVVSDPACELTHGLDLLGLAQALVESSLIRDVGEDAVPLRLAVLLDEHGLVADPDVIAVPVPHPVLRDQGAAQDRPLLLLDGGGEIVRVDTRAPWRRMPAPLLGRPAQHALDRRADVVPVAGEDRGAIDDRRQALDELPIALFIVDPFRHQKRDRFAPMRS